MRFLLNRKEQPRHRAVSLRQHGFLVLDLGSWTLRLIAIRLYHKSSHSLSLPINQSINQSIYLQKQAASETTVHRAGRPARILTGFITKDQARDQRVFMFRSPPQYSPLVPFPALRHDLRSTISDRLSATYSSAILTLIYTLLHLTTLCLQSRLNPPAPDPLSVTKHDDSFLCFLRSGPFFCFEL